MYASAVVRIGVRRVVSGATVESCVAAAQASGLRYAGLQYYGWCFGGDVLGYVQAAESECNTPCTTNSAQICGGSYRNSVYEIGSSAPTSAQSAFQ